MTFITPLQAQLASFIEERRCYSYEVGWPPKSLGGVGCERPGQTRKSSGPREPPEPAVQPFGHHLRDALQLGVLLKQMAQAMGTDIFHFIQYSVHFLITFYYTTINGGTKNN